MVIYERLTLAKEIRSSGCQRLADVGKCLPYRAFVRVLASWLVLGVRVRLTVCVRVRVRWRLLVAATDRAGRAGERASERDGRTATRERVSFLALSHLEPDSSDVDESQWSAAVGVRTGQRSRLANLSAPDGTLERKSRASVPSQMGRISGSFLALTRHSQARLARRPPNRLLFSRQPGTPCALPTALLRAARRGQRVCRRVRQP